MDLDHLGRVKREGDGNTLPVNSKEKYFFLESKEATKKQRVWRRGLGGDDFTNPKGEENFWYQMLSIGDMDGDLTGPKT